MAEQFKVLTCNLRSLVQFLYVPVTLMYIAFLPAGPYLVVVVVVVVGGGGGGGGEGLEV